MIDSTRTLYLGQVARRLARVIGTAIQKVGPGEVLQACSGTYGGDLPDPDFRLNVLHVRHDEDFPLHGHEYAELVLVLGGRALHLTDVEEYPIEAGDVFVINDPHRHGFRDVRSLQLCNIQFDPEQLFEGAPDLERMMGFHALFDLETRERQRASFRQRLRLSEAELGEAGALARLIEDELKSGHESDGRKTMALSTFLLLVTRLCRLYAEQKEASDAPVVRMAKVIAHIRRHFHEPLAVEDLADIAQLSPSQFQRTFRRLYSTTPIGFITRLRIEEACSQLRDPDRGIASIAEGTGFSTAAFFSTQFRKTMGQTPRDYRKTVLAIRRSA